MVPRLAHNQETFVRFKPSPLWNNVLNVDVSFLKTREGVVTIVNYVKHRRKGLV